MTETHGRVGVSRADPAAPDLTAADMQVSDTADTGASTSEDIDQGAPSPRVDPSLMDEASALIDNARTYAESELGFQKTRAALAGRYLGVAAGLGVLAVILLHIAFLALAVGLVLAFEPLVGIWGAIAIVFGGLLLIVALLGWRAFVKIQKMTGLFSSSDDNDGDEGEAA
ncbi:phage holin family protein [Qipengyuania sp. S6317L1]|uniref:phage holin family protein n=1 Tax=Qipengyuania sp. S6317L1 TaxID=2926410 RepID=UPI001FF6444D|nr:phage holin family protein [Qipengyuania sp. S6317L1]MCK0100589.1 phage holin family protein [Qipengyuania sp. S6317L1]